MTIKAYVTVGPLWKRKVSFPVARLYSYSVGKKTREAGNGVWQNAQAVNDITKVQSSVKLSTNASIETEPDSAFSGCILLSKLDVPLEERF